MELKRKPYSITLDERLVREAKKSALDESKPLYKFVEDALRLALAQAKNGTAPEGTQDGTVG